MSHDDFCREDWEKIVKPPTVNRIQDGGHNSRDIEPEKLERIFRALTSQRRRYILYELQENNVAGVNSLATAVTAMVQETPKNKVSSEDAEKMKSRLIHSELPNLVDAGLIEYDSRSKTVRYSDQSPIFIKILELCANVDSQSLLSE